MSSKLKLCVLFAVLTGISIFTLLYFPPEQSQTSELTTTVSSAHDELNSLSSDLADRGTDHELPPALAPLDPEDAANCMAVSGTMVNLPEPGSGQEPAPVPNFSFTCTLHTWPAFGKTYQKDTVTTDEAGRFQLHLRDPGEYPLKLGWSIAHDENYRYIFGGIKIEEDHPQEMDALIERIPHGTLYGETRSMDGSALAGVHLRFHGEMIGSGNKPGEEIEVISDGAGRFRIDRFQGQSRIEADLEGYRKINMSSFGTLPKGGWKPLQIILGPCNLLILRAVDSMGQPVEGVEVEVDVSQEESPSIDVFLRGNLSRKVIHGTTDENGWIPLQDVWAEQKLAITVKYKECIWRSEGIRNHRLVIDHEDGRARPIIVPRLEPCEIVIPIPEAFRIHGRVSHADGSVVPNPLIELCDRSLEGDKKSFPFDRHFRGDDQGNFELMVYSPYAPQDLWITAADAPDDFKFESMYNFEFKNRTTRALVPEKGINEIYAELVIESSLTIEGRVITGDKNPVYGSIEAKPAGSGMSRIYSLKRNAWLNKDGTFQLDGLESRAYDLTVKLEENEYCFFYCFPQLFEGIKAGTRDLRLTIQKPPPVNLSMEVRSGKGEVVSIIPSLIRYPSTESLASKSRSPDRIALFDNLQGWPHWVGLTLTTGISMRYDEEHYLQYNAFMPQKSNQFSYPPMSPGLYRINVRAYDEKNRLYHPAGTELICLEPGDYHFSFVVHRNADLEGRLIKETGTLDPDLCVALKDSDGKFVPVQHRKRYKKIIPTRAYGKFMLNQTPIGKFTLQVGLEDELLSGHFIHQQEVNIREGENPILIINLP